MARGRGRATGGHRRNAGNPDRFQNPQSSSGQNRSFRDVIASRTATPRGNLWQNPGNPRTNLSSGTEKAPPVREQSGWPWSGSAGGGVGHEDRKGKALAESLPHTPIPDRVLPPLSSESPTWELQELKISSPTSETTLKEPVRLPMRRPDAGGKDHARQMELLVNHFRVQFRPEFTILLYTVEIKLEKPLKENDFVKISKFEAHLLRDQLFSNDLSRFPMSMTAYDGDQFIYSAVELPTGGFPVIVSKGEDMGPCTYILSIKLAKKIELRVLDEYLKGRALSIPRDVLQGMDIVMRENPRRNQMLMGRGFYSRSPDRNFDIGEGIMASTGFQHSLKLTCQGLSLCVDYAVMPFRKSVPVLQYLHEHLNIQLDKEMPLNRNQIAKVQKALEGLKVKVIHRKTKQKFTIMGLTKSRASCITFDIQDPKNVNLKRKVALVDYFMNTFNLDIQYRQLPCLDFSKSSNKNFVPMEFCVLVEGQRYPINDLSSRADGNLRQISLISPMERKQMICDKSMQLMMAHPGEIPREFGITVGTMMTQVTSRGLSLPALKLRTFNDECRALTPEGNCHYSFQKHKVLDGKDIVRWGILDFSHHWSGNRKYMHLQVDRFTQEFISRSRQLGIHMENYLFYEPSSMDILSNAKALSDLLKYVYYDLAESNLQILVCPMADKHQGYKNLKRICETEIGVMTQCCLSNLANKCHDAYFANMALKMNAKAGGTNAELYQRLPNLDGDGHVMLIGADVNHPTDRFGPSITSVVATMNWPAANGYASRLRAQPRAERIKDIGEMCLELVEAYAEINGVKPEKIIFFRDGVGESEFEMVLNVEMEEVLRAIEIDGYKPMITLVIAQKRHLTRLFPKNEKDSGNKGNIEPGTVVDSIIIYPKEFDFYLNSHYGSLGTSRPTHYHVLWDDNAFSSDQLQRLIYSLCYTFPRCTKPITLVPPVYYADLVAYRGQQYYESLAYLSSPDSASTSSLTSISSASLPPFDHIKFPKLHSGLENLMICK